MVYKLVGSDEECPGSPSTEFPVALNFNPLHSSVPSIELPTRRHLVLIARWQIHGLTHIINRTMYDIPCVTSLNG